MIAKSEIQTEHICSLGFQDIREGVTFIEGDITEFKL